MIHSILPSNWQSRLADDHLREIQHGMSTSTVYAVVRDRAPIYFIKSEPVSEFAELTAEHDKLVWLKSKSVPCPGVVDFATDNGRHWLLMDAVPGCDLSMDNGLNPVEKIELMIGALRTLHDLPINDCPFDMRLSRKLDAATKRMNAGLIDESDFDVERRGVPVETLHHELLSTRPVEEELAVTHGDTCLPNFIVADGNFLGFIDCARLGIADKAQDIALAARSIDYNLGQKWRDRFLAHYGLTHDDPTLAYYRLLDEFF